MKKMSTLFLSVFLSLPVAANSSDVVFSCSIKTGKVLSVTKQDSDYLFSYDKISFKSPINQVVKNSDSFIAGGSGFITSSLELKDNGISYTIQFSQPRKNLKKLDDIEISISKGEQVRFLECDTHKKIHHNFDKKIMRKEGFLS